MHNLYCIRVPKLENGKTTNFMKYFSSILYLLPSFVSHHIDCLHVFINYRYWHFEGEKLHLFSKSLLSTFYVWLLVSASEYSDL